MLKKTKMDLGSNNSDLFDKLVKYCMASGAINLDLLNMMLREDLEILTERVYLPDSQRFPMYYPINL